MARKKSGTESHVRLYGYEMKSPAWTTLNTDARSLLVELRALFRPSQANVVYLSVREAEKRLGVRQRRVQAAFQQLLDRGWITVHERGSFHQKIRHATSYRLANEAGAAPGATPSKEYLRWRPDDTSKTR